MWQGLDFESTTEFEELLSEERDMPPTDSPALSDIGAEFADAPASPGLPPPHQLPPSAPLPQPEAAPSGTAASPDGSSGTAAGEELDEGRSPETAVLSLLRPVTITMLLVVLLVHGLAESPEKIAGSFSQLMVYDEKEDDAASTIAGGGEMPLTCRPHAPSSRALARHLSRSLKPPGRL